MSDLQELYQEMILDHGRKPRNFGPLEDANHHAVGHNPLCGDHFSVRLRTADGIIVDARFEGAGCAISTASASMMTQLLKGKSLEEADEIFSRFHELIAGEGDADDPKLGKLAVFAGVKRFPTRVKCATLAWHTVHAALGGQSDPVSTE